MSNDNDEVLSLAWLQDRLRMEREMRQRLQTKYNELASVAVETLSEWDRFYNLNLDPLRMALRRAGYDVALTEPKEKP